MKNILWTLFDTNLLEDTKKEKQLKNGNTILDIGTGTGLISLMLAQRFPLVTIDAIEIDNDAFLQAKENFDNAPFSDRLTIFNSSLQDYSTNKK